MKKKPNLSPVHYKDEWKSVFNWTMGYRTDNDIWRPYTHMVWRNTGDMMSDQEYCKYDSIIFYLSVCTIIMIVFC